MNRDGVGILLVVALALSALAAAPQQRAAQTAVVRFGDLGTLRIQSIEPVDDQPELVISDARSGHEIFWTNLGEASFPEEAAKPRLRFAVVNVPGSKSPLILAVTGQGTADGCLSDAIVVGERNRGLATLTVTPSLKPKVWGEGVYLGDLANSLGFGLAVWEPAIGDESMMDSHQYAVSLYHYEAMRPQFTLIRKVTSIQKYGMPEDALAELGLPRYKNLDTGC
jgi:hypothetical protein